MRRTPAQAHAAFLMARFVLNTAIVHWCRSCPQVPLMLAGAVKNVPDFEFPTPEWPWGYGPPYGIRDPGAFALAPFMPAGAVGK